MITETVQYHAPLWFYWRNNITPGLLSLFPTALDTRHLSPPHLKKEGQWKMEDLSTILSIAPRDPALQASARQDVHKTLAALECY